MLITENFSQQNSVLNELKEYRQKINDMNQQSKKIYSEVLEKEKFSSLDEDFQTLVKKINELKNFSKGGFSEKIIKIAGNIPFLGKKIQEKMEKIEIESKSLKSFIEEIEKLVENLEKEAEEGLKEYFKISQIINAMQNEIESIMRELEKKMQNFSEEEKVEAQSILRELQTLYSLNKKDQKDIKEQILTYSVIKNKIAEVRPYVESYLRKQLILNTRNQKIQNFFQSWNLIKDVLNDMIVLNEENQKALLENAIRFAGNDFIKSETIKAVRETDRKFREEFKKIQKEIKEEHQKMDEEVRKMIQELEEKPLILEIFEDKKLLEK